VVQLLDRPVVKFSDLQREPRKVSHEVDSGPIRVTRRDGSPLVLMRESEINHLLDGMNLVSKIVSICLAESAETADERLNIVFPWAAYLRPHERPAFLREMVETARACTATENYVPLIACVNGWRATAEAYAAGWDHNEPEWLEKPILVPRPETVA